MRIDRRKRVISGEADVLLGISHLQRCDTTLGIPEND